MQGAFEMTNYLVSLGHKRIGFIHGPEDHRAGYDRFAGYKKAIHEAGIVLDSDIIIKGDDLFESCFLGTMNLPKLGAVPSAIFFSTTK